MAIPLKTLKALAERLFRLRHEQGIDYHTWHTLVKAVANTAIPTSQVSTFLDKADWRAVPHAHSTAPVRGIYPRPAFTVGWYEHYKGGLYDAYGLSQDEATGIWHVLYRNPRSGEPFHRPHSEWVEVMADGRQRFTPVSHPTGEV